MGPNPPIQGGRSRSRDAVALAILGIALVLWSAFFIASTSFVADRRRFFCLFDDAMISMTYARNLLDGFGLNWARWGRPVEGFTHPLWVLAMVPINLIAPRAWAALGVQILSLCCLLADLVLVHRLARRLSGSSLAAFVAAAVTATYYPLNHWALQGMESGLQAFLIAWVANIALDFARNEQPGAWKLALIVGTSLLLRSDMVVPISAALAFLVASGGLKRASARQWAWAVALAVVAPGAWQVFRWVYFGDVLPNTYYLKMTGVPANVRMLRGWLVFVDFLEPLTVPVSLAIGLGLAAIRRERALLLPLGIVVACFGYSIYVGGDAWEWSSVGANRFTSIAMPMLFVLGVSGAQHMAALAGSKLVESRKKWLQIMAVASFGLMLGVSANALWGTRRSAEKRRNWTLAEIPLHVNDNAIAVRETLALSRLTTPRIRVALGWAGIPAFFSNWELVDLLGYNDALLAKRPVTRPVSIREPLQLKPGHMKADLDFSLTEGRPDVVFQLWALESGGLEQILQRHGFEHRGAYWFRRGGVNQ
jgi:hypothetical protein